MNQDITLTGIRNRLSDYLTREEKSALVVFEAEIIDLKKRIDHLRGIKFHPNMQSWEDVESEIASFKEKLQGEIYQNEKQAEYNKRYRTILQKKEIIIKHRNTQIADLKEQTKKAETHLQEVCAHEGESKNGICIDCGALI